MSPWTAVLVFVGIPAAIFGLVAVAVVLSSGRSRPYDPYVVIGAVREETGCAIRTDADGRQVHEPRPGTTPTCVTARCAECRTVFRDGAHDVHFAGRGECVATVTARGWRLAGPRLRCPSCR
ncbi:hypothetical protein [Pseudonocardia sp. GCM10023141]|uniref:hypothetical protein n=1 Tax=Pseudonocardia sp. GCM10023141 TaxID=3252653 RepID=UPI003620D652